MTETDQNNDTPDASRRRDMAILNELLTQIGSDALIASRRFRVIRTSRTEDRDPIDPGIRWIVYRRNHFACVWCGTPDNLQIDHIVPWSAGGSDDIDNLRTLCDLCNADRSNEGNAFDLNCRQLPFAVQCIYCYPDELLGDPELRPTFCIQCRREATGIPFHGADSPGWEDSPPISFDKDDFTGWEWEAMNEPAPTTAATPLAVRCRYCGAHPSEPCINLVNHQPLKYATAHPMRLRDAGISPDDETPFDIALKTKPADDDEEPF